MSTATTPRSPGADTHVADAHAKVQRALEVCARHTGASFENVWHALILLDQAPIERLNRALIRGQYDAVHR